MIPVVSEDKPLPARCLRNACIVFCVLLFTCALLPAQAAIAPGAGTSPDAEVREFRLGALATTLHGMPPGPERDYFAGVLANREGRIEESIHLLTGSMPALRASQPARAAVALEALADDYNKSFRYADAARTYEELLAHFAHQLDHEKLQGTRDDAGVMHLLSGSPVQTITWHGPVRLKTERNPLGSLVTQLDVNGVRAPWLLDTGANLSVVSRSFAQRTKLKPLPGYGETQAGITGIENPLQVALVPTLTMGGATLHNVVVLILDDASLKIALGKASHQIDAIVGYPVFQALGAITFQHDGWFEASHTAPNDTSGARMYMKLLMPVIACSVDGAELPFSFDTGASETMLSLRYYNRFRAEASPLQWKKGESRTAGAGGVVQRTIYVQPQLKLTVGNTVATLQKMPILTQEMGSDIDEMYGNLGQDLVAGYSSFTLDFTAMRFRLGTPLSTQRQNVGGVE